MPRHLVQANVWRVKLAGPRPNSTIGAWGAVFQIVGRTVVPLEPRPSHCQPRLYVPVSPPRWVALPFLFTGLVASAFSTIAWAASSRQTNTAPPGVLSSAMIAVLSMLTDADAISRPPGTRSRTQIGRAHV